MEPSNEYLRRLTGEAITLAYRASDKYEVYLTPHTSMVLSGEPVLDLNYIFINAEPQAEEYLRKYINLVRSKNIPVMVFLSDEVVPQLTPVAGSLGLQYAERVPFMIYSPESNIPDAGSNLVTRVENELELMETNALMAYAFGMPVSSVNRVFKPEVLDAPGLETFFLRQNGNVISAVQTTRTGSIIGIWGMSTSPEYQHKGLGKSLLMSVIKYHYEKKCKHFYLGATTAGKPLYEKIGFRTVYQASVWILK